MSRLSASWAASWLALSLVVTPSFASAAPKGAVPVQDVDDLFLDEEDLLVDDDEEEEKAPRKPVRRPAKPEPEPEPEPELDDEMPAGDGDMPMGDYDLEHSEPEPEPEPVEPVKPVKPVQAEPEAASPVTSSSGSSSSGSSSGSSGRRLIGAEQPEPGREILTETEELPTVGIEEPEEADSGALVWVITGVGAAVGVAALTGLGVGAYVLLGGAGGPTGTVTITPH